MACDILIKNGILIQMRSIARALGNTILFIIPIVQHFLHRVRNLADWLMNRVDDFAFKAAKRLMTDEVSNLQNN